MSDHKLKIGFGGGVIHSKLVCPESGCRPADTCGQCGRVFGEGEGEDESERCPFCGDERERAVEAGCWLRTWADNEDLTEYLEGEVTINIASSWEDDGPLLEVDS